MSWPIVLNFNEPLWRLGCDLTIGIFLGSTLYINRKLRLILKQMRKDSEQLSQFNRNKFPMLIAALERVARMACPLCAIAAGNGRGELDGDRMDVDEEVEGKHAVYVRGTKHSEAECRAVEIRNQARQLFKESVGYDAAFVTVLGDDDGKNHDDSTASR
jgi:hypothetical protein